MKLEELLNKKYERFSPGDRLIARYLMTHQAESRRFNCEQLASACHISRATLLRFCRKLGLASFAELKYLLKITAPLDLPSPDALERQFEQYHRLMDEIEKRDYREICTLLHRASTIYLYGTGNAQKSEAEAFKRMFLAAGKCVIDLFDLGEIAFAKEAFRGGDLFIIISLSGETAAGIEILRQIDAMPAETLSITRWDNNTIARMCRYNLYVDTKTLQGYRDFSYEMIGAFYMLIDALFVNYIEMVRRGQFED